MRKPGTPPKTDFEESQLASSWLLQYRGVILVYCNITPYNARVDLNCSPKSSYHDTRIHEGSNIVCSKKLTNHTLG